MVGVCFVFGEVSEVWVEKGFEVLMLGWVGGDFFGKGLKGYLFG